MSDLIRVRIEDYHEDVVLTVYDGSNKVVGVAGYGVASGVFVEINSENFRYNQFEYGTTIYLPNTETDNSYDGYYYKLTYEGDESTNNDFRIDVSVSTLDAEGHLSIEGKAAYDNDNIIDSETAFLTINSDALDKLTTPTPSTPSTFYSVTDYATESWDIENTKIYATKGESLELFDTDYLSLELGNFTFTSSDTSIATVSSAGIVTAKNIPGTTYIDVTCGSKTIVVEVIVTPYPSTIKIDSMILEMGTKALIEPTFNSDKVNVADLVKYTITKVNGETHSGDDADKCDVLDILDGGVIFTKEEGTVTIKASIEVNSIPVETTFAVAVQDTSKSGEINTVSILEDITEIAYGGTATFSAIDTASIKDGLEWTIYGDVLEFDDSHNPDANGVVAGGSVTVKAVDGGSAILWVKNSDGDTDSRVITVKEPITGETIINVDDPEEFTFNIDGATGVDWESSDPLIFTVAPDSSDTTKATVKGVSAGTATLTATYDGEVYTIAIEVSGEEIFINGDNTITNNVPTEYTAQLAIASDVDTIMWTVTGDLEILSGDASGTNLVLGNKLNGTSTNHIGSSVIVRGTATDGTGTLTAKYGSVEKSLDIDLVKETISIMVIQM